MDCSLRNASAKLFLVHGTWGRGFNPPDVDQPEASTVADVRWFMSGSPFHKALELGLLPAVHRDDIASFPWSGANSIEARQCAARKLAARLDESTASSPNVRHFIVAHSHGGNVAVAARQAMSRDTQNVHIITMATPFLSIRQPAPGRTERLFTIALSIGLIIFTGYLTYLFLPFIVALLALPFYLSKVSSALYATGRLPPVIPRHIINLKIIRGYRDEASLALLAGKVASSMAQIAGSLSLLVPLIAAVLSALLLIDMIFVLVSVYRKYKECVQIGTPCVIPGEYYAFAAISVLQIVADGLRFLAVGFCVSALSIALAALCKSVFGRELLYRSLNATVDVHDCPDDSRTYQIDWCQPVKGNFFGLRHSLYSNPRAIEKITK
jgi:hypothetical protein